MDYDYLVPVISNKNHSRDPHSWVQNGKNMFTLVLVNYVGPNSCDTSGISDSDVWPHGTRASLIQFPALEHDQSSHSRKNMGPSTPKTTTDSQR